MFCIDNRCTDVYFNLAAEEYLLKKKKDNFFMMWQSVPSVVIGKHQSVRKEVDEKYIHENNILLARRFSGGGAVYHDEGNLNLSFMETVERPDFEYYLQQTVDFLRMRDAELTIHGRHDPAIIRRICPVLDSVTALVLCDLLAQRFGTDYFIKEAGR